MTVHLIKLCVGVSDVSQLLQEHERLTRQALKRKKSIEDHHWTRMRPKRAEEVIEGGSLFWVIRGIIRVRHRILRLDHVRDADGQEYCAIIYDPRVILVEPRPRRAFQGWRYLEVEDAPPDLPNQRQALANAAAEGDMPPQMLAELRILGLF
ncbi:MAG TPA: DUF1489 domain-containing protein [Pseudolabrys sp.]|nr:DUF1489 domain-containing protein [Pseudolabrys sp.]